MSAFKDVYDVLKDLKQVAEKLKYSEMISLATDVQAKLFELKEELESVKDENRQLKDEIMIFKNSSINEKDIVYCPHGYFTLNNEHNELPYCSACWRENKKVVPLARQGAYWQYKCPKCQTQIYVNPKDTRM